MKTIFILALMAFWVTATHHCRLELLPGLDFLACLSAENDSHHESSGCETDGCATVESSLYKSENNRLPLVQPSFILQETSVLETRSGPPDLPARACVFACDLSSLPPPGTLMLRHVISPRAPSPVT